MSPRSEKSQFLIAELWDRLADFEATHTEEALHFLLRELKSLAGADDAVWVGVVRMAHGEAARRDHQLGWRGRVQCYRSYFDSGLFSFNRLQTFLPAWS